MVSGRRQERSLGVAVLAGTGVGLAVLAFYIVGGLVVANWSLDEFVANLGPEVVGTLLLAGGVAVACFAVPVAAYLRFRVVSPLVVLAAIVLGWVGYGTASGVLTSETVFGLAVYAVYLAPFYLVVYAVVGTVEHYAHR